MWRRDGWRSWLALVVIALAPLLVAPVHVAADDLSSSHVPDSLRCDDAYLTAAIARGLASSAALRELADRLLRDPIIVYVHFNDAMHRDLLGRTRLSAVAHGWRYVTIELTPRLIRRDVVAMFGHELQHAVEIAEGPEIVDVESVVALYRRIGSVVSIDGRAFESDAAIAVERRVLLELIRDGW
jgi:hypothetical protein